MSQIALELPRVPAEGIQHRAGHVILSAPESLRVNPTSSEGLRAVTVEEAVTAWPANTRRQPDGFRPVVAYTFAEEATRLELAVERRKPQVHVRQLLVANIETGVIQYDAKFHYDVRYSAVPLLRIDIPTPLAADVRNASKQLREKPMDPQPDDVAEGYTAWQFTRGSEVLGSHMIHLHWEIKVEDLDVGKTVGVMIPELRPRLVDRAWGQIVLTKTESMDIREGEKLAGINPIDPQHDLHGGMKIDNAARAFEFHDDQWSLPIRITRYELEELKSTSIERAVVEMVLTRSDEISVRALYRIRSARQRLALTFPGTVSFDSQPVRINGRPIALERGDKQDYFIPLTDVNPDAPFLLDLRYTMQDDGQELQCPRFPLEPAMQKVYLSAYVPDEWDYLGATGPWTDEQHWVASSLMDRRPVPNMRATQLTSWVQEGVNVDPSTIPSFATDGRMLLFSTMLPDREEAKALHLMVLNRNWLNTIVLLPIVIGGLLLIRARFAWRWMALGLLLVVIILCGVFLPTFSKQITDGKLQAAVLLILVIWGAHYVAWIRPRDPQRLALQQARHEERLAAIQARTAEKEVRAQAPPPPDASKTDAPSTSSGDSSGHDAKGGSSDA